MAGQQSPSKRKGVAGASNAKNIPYRYCGGDHDRPKYHQSEMQLARKVGPSDFRDTATYATGVLGGILAKLWMNIPLSLPEMELIGRV